jgi:type IV secretion system protein VirB4
MFELEGIDEEGLTDEAVAGAAKRIEGALKGLPENGRVYQYMRVRKGFEIPRQATYDNSQVQDAIRTRIAFLDGSAEFRRIELFWAITVEPANKDSFASKALSPDQYARQTARLIAQVERTAEVFTAQLAGTLHPRLLEKDEVASFFAYLVNLEPWSLDISLISPERVDQQIVRSSIEWLDDHLRLGKQHVRLFSLLDSPAASRANLFGMLQQVNANAILCSTWVPRSRADVQKRISQIEGFTGISKHKVLALAANLRNPENLERSVGAKALRRDRRNWRTSSAPLTMTVTTSACIP